jgi:isoleucyl-tRNA synthetase
MRRTANHSASLSQIVCIPLPFTDRIAFWVDLDDAYWTMSPDYIETVWWLLKEIWEKGLLEEERGAPAS